MYHIMREEDFKHVWTLDRHSWWIRLFIWMWSVEQPKSITFCRLFWGYTFAWVALTIHVFQLLALPLVKANEQIEARQKSAPPPEWQIIFPDTIRAGRTYYFRTEQKSADWYTNRHQWRVDDELVHSSEIRFASPGKHTITAIWQRVSDGATHSITETVRVYGPTLGERILPKIEDAAAWIGMQCRRPWVAAFGQGIAWAAILAGFGTIALGIGMGAYVLVPLIVAGFVMAPWIAGGTTFAVALMLIAAWLVARYDKTSDIAEGIWHVVRPVKRASKSTSIGLFKAFIIGYKSIKGNTCPRVMLTEGDQ